MLILIRRHIEEISGYREKKYILNYVLDRKDLNVSKPFSIFFFWRDHTKHFSISPNFIIVKI